MNKIEKIKRTTKETAMDVLAVLPWILALVGIGILVTLGVPHLVS